jgi:RNA 3'-terminal phosphate cyclase (ATP)
MKDQKPVIELDGRTGEGGGQLVRIASALAAVATQPIRITNVRGNRGDGARGGGMHSCPIPLHSLIPNHSFQH